MDQFGGGRSHIVLCFGTQLGKTETLYNVLGYIIDLEPYSTLLVYPRQEDAKSVSRARIQPMIEANPHLAAKKPTRDGLFQLCEMHFPGMVVFVVGANSAAALSQKPCRNVIRDEVDKYPDQIGDDSDPLSLSEERTKSFWDIRKIVDVSSPTVDTRGIWKLLQSCDEIQYYYVPCPFCGTFQKLDFKNIKYDSAGETPAERVNRARNTATLECILCQKAIGTEHKMEILAGGKWVVEKKSPFPAEKVGFHLSSLYSPWLTWGDIAGKFLAAHIKYKETGDTSELQSVVNGWFAEPWVMKVETVKENALTELKTERPPLIVPHDAVALTAGIDVQKYGFYFSVWAFRRNLASDMIQYGYLESWDAVFNLLFNTTYKIEDSHGQYMGIWRAAIDSGGGETEGSISVTDAVYDKVRHWPRGVLAPIKGLSRNRLPGVRVRASTPDKIRTSKGIKVLPSGITIWLLDTSALKDLFFWRLQVAPNEGPAARFHAETGDDYFNHLLAEERRKNRAGQYYWEQIRKDNHYLDTSIYAHAAADPQWNGGVTILPERMKMKLLEPAPPPAQDGEEGWIRSRGNWLNQG